MEFLARLGRILCAGLFLRLGPYHFERETGGAPGDDGKPRG
jgi:hypothetical protein